MRLGGIVNIDDYLRKQAQFVKSEYLRDYDVRDFPAVSYESWVQADKQIKLANTVNGDALAWVGPTVSYGKWRALHHKGDDFFQFWVRHDARDYLVMAKGFLAGYYGVSKRPGLQLDHVIPRSRFDGQYPDGVTVGYFIPSSVNASWGGGYERAGKGHRLKIRNAATLVTVAKSLGIRGPSIIKRRTVRDIAVDLARKSIISKMYESAAYSTYSEIEKLENELGLAMRHDVAPLMAR